MVTQLRRAKAGLELSCVFSPAHAICFSAFFFFLPVFLPLRLWVDVAAGPGGILSEGLRGHLSERAGGRDMGRKEK